MGTPTVVPGSASESAGSAATNGFTGWSPEADRTTYTVRNGSDGSVATAYADSTAYAVGKSVTYNGSTYVVKAAVGAGNTTKPDANASFVPVDNRRGAAEFTSPATRRKQFYR